MKLCSTCNQLKELTEFNKNKYKSDGLQTVCRSCNKEYAKKYYKKNSGRQITQIIDAQIRRRNANRLKVVEYLIQHPCVDCGESDIIVLEFDHLPEYNKFKDVSSLIREGYSWNRIKEEIEKCEVVCCNCHRRRTSKRGGWWKEEI